MQAIFFVINDERVEYFINELVFGYRVESLTKVYCGKKCSERRLCCIKAFENCLRHVCEETAYGMVGSETELGG